MQLCRTIRLGTFGCDDEVLSQCGKELLVAHAVEVLDDAVVVENSELTCREADGHEVVVLLVATMIRVLLCLLSTHERSRSTAMVSVCYI